MTRDGTNNDLSPAEATTGSASDPAAIVEAARAAGCGDLVAPDGCWLAFSSGRLVVASEAGRHLATRERWDEPEQAWPRRFGELAPRWAAGGPVRFERVRLAGSRRPTLLALRAVPLGSETILLVAADAAVASARAPAGPIAATREAFEHGPTVVMQAGVEPVPPAAVDRSAMPAERVRAIWRTDAAERLAFSDARASERLGARDGDAWCDRVSGEPSGLLSARRPFTAVRALWRSGPDDATLPVLLSGAPFALAGAFAGFRGFALYDGAEADRIAAARRAGVAAASLPEDAGGTGEGSADNTVPDAEPASLGHAPDAIEPPFAPIFQAIVDASVSGWAQLMDAIPAGRRPQEPAERTRSSPPVEEPAPAPETVASTVGAPAETAAETGDIPGSEGGGTDAGEPSSTLSTTERGALSEIARVLGARIEGEPDPAEEAAPERESATVLPLVPPRAREGELRRALDEAAMAALVHARGQPVFANAAFLDLIGVADLSVLRSAEWTRDLVGGEDTGERDPPARPRRLRLPCGEVEAVSSPVEWSGRRACLTLVWTAAADPAVVADGFAAELARRDERVADLNAALATVDEGLVRIDSHGRITAVSGAAQAQFGYAENEIAGEQLPVLFAPESRGEAFALVERVRLALPPLGSRLRARGLRRDGSAVDLDVTARRLGELDGGTVLVAFSDVSREREMEASLGAVHRDLEAAHRQSGEILARVGHEIRSPLTAIIGFADLLLEERLGPLQDERLRPYLEGIRSSGLEVIERVGHFRRYTDALSGRMEMRPAACDLNAILSDTVAALHAQSVRDRVVVRTSLAAELPPTWLDAASTRQAVTHLLSGAIALTPPGGQVITATARADNGDIAWSVKAKDARLAPDDLEAALDPFTARTNSLALPRSGFTLAFARALIEANGASLTTTDLPGDGPLFEIRFAAMPATDAAALRQTG